MNESKSGRFKQPIIEKLGPFFESKGFKEDKKSLMSNNFGFVYSKGDPEPHSDEYLKSIKRNKPLSIPREEIIVSRMRWGPLFTVDLRSLLRNPACTNLWQLANHDIQKMVAI